MSTYSGGSMGEEDNFDDTEGAKKGGTSSLNKLEPSIDQFHVF